MQTSTCSTSRQFGALLTTTAVNTSAKNVYTPTVGRTFAVNHMSLHTVARQDVKDGTDAVRLRRTRKDANCSTDVRNLMARRN